MRADGNSGYSARCNDFTARTYAMQLTIGHQHDTAIAQADHFSAQHTIAAPLTDLTDFTYQYIRPGRFNAEPSQPPHMTDLTNEVRRMNGIDVTSGVVFDVL